MRPNIAKQLREEAVTQALQTIERRVNELGVAEPIVARQGPADQILVQLPGVTDVARAKEIIRTTALLELKLVEQGPFPSEEAALQAYNNTLPPDLMIVPGSQDVAGTGGGTPSTVYYVVRRVAPVTGRDLRTARTVARPEQSAGRGVHAEPGRRAAIRPVHGAEHRPAARRSFSTTACSRRRRSRGASPTRGRLRAASRSRRRSDLVAGAPKRRVAGIARLPRRADRRSDARAPTRFERA